MLRHLATEDRDSSVAFFLSYEPLSGSLCVIKSMLEVLLFNLAYYVYDIY